MIDSIPFASISDDELLSTVRRLSARSNGVLADLLVHLGEVELRGIHRLRACASLYTYCIYELRMSEDAAFRRSKAARLVREHPEVRDMVARGELHLTGLLMIGPYLGGERHAEILERARFRTKSEIARLIAAIDPKPDVPALMEPIGSASRGAATHREFVESLSGPVRTLPRGERPEDWLESRPAARSATRDDAGLDGGGTAGTLDETEGSQSDLSREPEHPLRYKVQFTGTQEYVDLVNEACDLLSHETPRPDLPDVQLRAMRELVKQLKKRKRAATEPMPNPDATNESVSGHADTAPAREHGAESADNALAREYGVESADNALAREYGAEPADNALAREYGAEPATTAPARYISAAVRRAVWARDGERCAYVDGRGHRCRESRGLELHHRRAHALSGLPTFDNLEVRCKAHNLLAAEDDFGREYVDHARGVLHAGRMA